VGTTRRGTRVPGRGPLTDAQSELERERIDAGPGDRRSDPHVSEARVEDLAARDAGATEY
jgi:hypothetical protein